MSKTQNPHHLEPVRRLLMAPAISLRMDARMAAAEAIKAEAGAERFGGQPPRGRDRAEEGQMK